MVLAGVAGTVTGSMVLVVAAESQTLWQCQVLAEVEDEGKAALCGDGGSRVVLHPVWQRGCDRRLARFVFCWGYTSADDVPVPKYIRPRRAQFVHRLAFYARAIVVDTLTLCRQARLKFSKA